MKLWIIYVCHATSTYRIFFWYAIDAYLMLYAVMFNRVPISSTL
uniref:Uncharacterized protein n=1 Tax=Arundo donax TaxID=35708 RepID=A0A0A9E865_ARUDO